MTTSPFIAAAIQFIAQTALSTALAIGVFVVAAPTKIGDRIIGLIFDKKLAAFKATQDKELEKLREQLAHFGDRGKRSNELEFAAISTVWNSFIEAHLATYQCIVNFLEHPDFFKMSSAEVAEYLDSTDLLPEQKSRVAQADDKFTAYKRAVHLNRLNKAANSIFDTRVELRKQSVFMPEVIYNLFDTKLNILFSAFLEEKLDFSRSRGHFDKRESLMNDSESIFSEVQAAVRSRLLRQDTKEA